MFMLKIVFILIVSVASGITVPPFWPNDDSFKLEPTSKHVEASRDINPSSTQINSRPGLSSSSSHFTPTTSDFKPITSGFRPITSGLNPPPKQLSRATKIRPEVYASNTLPSHLGSTSHEEFKQSLLSTYHQPLPNLATQKPNSSSPNSNSKLNTVTHTGPVFNYRPSNNQNHFIYHPKTSNVVGMQSPHSYQVVKFADIVHNGIVAKPNLGNSHLRRGNKIVHQKIEERPLRRQPKIYRNENVERSEEPNKSGPRRGIRRRKPQRSRYEENERVEEPRPTDEEKQNEDNVEQENSEEDHEELNEDDDESSEHEAYEDAAPISDHEHPRDIPTHPDYPGEGEWAKFGRKHKPYNGPPSPPIITHESDEDTTPEGHETYERGEENYKNSQRKFKHDLNTFPKRHQLKKTEIDESETESEPLYDKPELGFVPQKLYAQVRRTESESHHPRSEIDDEQEENAARLREVIKDSKIHTVYTEEGYEDSAYDHAGHEKKAENSEGHAQVAEEQAGASGKSRGGHRNGYNSEGGKKRGRDVVGRKYKDDDRVLNQTYSDSDQYKLQGKSNHDSLSSGSDTLPSKKVHTVTMKNKDADVDMEIHTEVKYTSGPNKKKHKFIKIIPSMKLDKARPTRRVKRYNQEKLAKLYVRKHPNYYWKKKSTNTRHKYIHSTTIRPDYNLRLRFETAFNRQSSIATNEDLIKPTITTTTTSTTPLTTTTPKPTTSKPTKSYPPKLFRVKVPKRTKRYTIDHPDVSVDLKEFLDVTKLSSPTQKPDLTFQKYPYYNLPQKNLNPDSPLRYAEDMANIPPKLEKDMAFYDSREHIKCVEVESDVNPIPDRIKEQEEGEETNEEADDADLPRLRGLGDKIDCFKEKYFGDNPLDSPFFKEEVIAQPVAFFPVKSSQKNQIQLNLKARETNLNKRDLKLKFLEPIVVDDLFESATANPIHRSTEAVLKPPYTITQMMNMYQNQPRNIYDQISPSEPRRKQSKRVKNPTDDFVIIYENPDAVKTVMDDSKHPLEYKLEEVKAIHNGYNSPKVSDIISDLTTLSHNIPKPEVINIVPPNISEIDLLYPTTTTEVSSSNEYQLPSIPVSTYKSRRTIQKYPRNNNPTSSTEVPFTSEDPSVTTSKIYFKKSRRTIQKRPENTLRKLSSKKILKPGHRTFKKINENSEATISSNSSIPLQIEDESYSKESVNVETIPIPEHSKSKMIHQFAPPSAKPLRIEDESLAEFKQTQPLYMEPTSQPDLSIFSRRITPFVIFDINKFIPRNPNHKVITSEVQYKEEMKPSDQMKVYNDVLKTINDTRNDELLEKNQPNKYVEDTPPIEEFKTLNSDFLSPETPEEEYSQEASEPIYGLIPPSINYHTIFSTISDTQDTPLPQATKNINQYYVHGMKPPPKKYQHNIYKRSNKTPKQQEPDDLLMEESHLIEHYLKRTKRQSTRDDLTTAETSYDVRKPAYTEIRRSSNNGVMTAESGYEVTPSRKPIVYTEIVRQRFSKPEASESVEEENLNPRKRVYQLMSRTTSTPELRSPDPELKYVDNQEEPIVEVDAPTTTYKPVFYHVEAHKENPEVAEYIYLIDKLHEKWEKEMPSTTEAPSTTSQKPEMVLTQSVAESVNVRRGEPAYLQIINQLHAIRKEIEDKTTTTTTTTEASIETTEDIQTFPMKNSNPFILEAIMPDSFMSELNSMQSKLENSEDSAARIRNLSSKFKTSIDTSKYQTIDRPVSIRHNFSSRFNSDDELPLSRGQTSQIASQAKMSASDNLEVYPLGTRSTNTPSGIQKDVTTEEATPAEVISAIVVPITKFDLESMKIETDSKSPELELGSSGSDSKFPTSDISSKPDLSRSSRTNTTTTIKPDSRSRSRTRFRSRPTTSTTATIVAITPNPILRRRRPTKPTITTSTPVKPDLISRRRSRLRTTEVPNNHKPTFTPILDSTTSTNEELKKPRKLQRIHERRVMSEVSLTRFYDPESDSEEDESLEESKKHQYEVIGPLLNTETGHGGNYKYFSTSETAPTMEESYGSTTAKPRSSNVLIQEEIEEITQKPIHTKVSLLPNMARMVNRLAEPQSEEIEDEDAKPMFIKDPSRRMYYYAKL